MALISPYRYLSQRPQSAASSILISPAVEPFSGLFAFIRQKDFFGTIVAITAILSKFMPILLSNIPFRQTQTWMAHLVCAWMTVAILSLMIVVLVGLLFVKSPYLPVDPATIAGRMYYLCDSELLEDLERPPVSDKEQGRSRFAELLTGPRFTLGLMFGTSGVKRVGIDYAGKHGT